MKKENKYNKTKQQCKIFNLMESSRINLDEDTCINTYYMVEKDQM